MTTYLENFKKIQSIVYSESILNGGSPLRALLHGGVEIEKYWNYQKEGYPIVPNQYLDFKNCKQLFEMNPEKEWEFFKIGAVEKMKEISINSPNDADTVVYCDETQNDVVILLEISKKELYTLIQDIAPKVVINNFRLDLESHFNAQIKLLNDKILHFPISNFINPNHCIRYISIKL